MTRIAMILALWVVLGACPADAATPRVVASIKPVHSLVASVMKDVAEPDLLVKGSASAHSFSLKPSDAKTLAAADIVFWVGPALETTLEKPLSSLSNKATVVALMQANGVSVIQEGPAGVDGHIWLDPVNARAMVATIADALSKADPAHATQYALNAASVRGQLTALENEIRAQVVPLSARPFIVFHDAYRYFTRRYGLNLVAMVTINPEQPPGARHVSDIKELITKGNAVCLFAEPQFQPKLMQTLTAGTQVKTGALDPEGIALPPGPGLYADLMNGLAANLVKCLTAP